MSAVSIAVSLIGNDMTAGAFGSVIGNANRLAGGLGVLGQSFAKLTTEQKAAGLAALGAAAAFEAFKAPVEFGVQAAAELESHLVSLENALQANADEAPLLTAAINDMAIKTVFSSGDVTDAFTQLNEMGFNTQEMLYGFSPAAADLMDGAYHAKEALDGVGMQAVVMAQAMKTDAVTGAQLLGSAMQVFSNEGLSAKQTADLLAGAFLNGVPSAEALQQAIAMSGASAATAGVHMDDFLTTLDLLVRNGMSASSAGASLNYMLQSLTAPTDKQKLALKDLGLVTLSAADNTKVLSSKLFDAQGNFIGLKGAIELIDQATIGKTAQEKMELFADLFNVRSGRAAKVLANIQDFDGQYNEIMSRFAGTDVSSMADKQLHTLLGSWDAFKDSFTSMMANIFLPILPPITNFILKINDLISSVTNLPQPVLQGIAIFLIMGAVISGIIMIVMGAIFILGMMATALAAIGLSGGALIGAFAAVAGVIAFLIGLFFGMKAAIENNSTLMNLWNGVIKFLGDMLGILKDQGMQLLDSLKLLLPVWDVLKVVLVVIGAVILGVIVVAIAIVIGVLIALSFIIRNAIQWFAAFGSGVGAVFSAIGTFVSQIPGWFQSAWAAVVKWTTDAWNTITTGIGDFFSGLGSDVQAGLKFVQDLFNNSVQAIVGFFKWLYDHNYYFQALVDFIREKFQWIKEQATAIWTAITSFLSGIWNGISNTARNIWNSITTAISSFFNQAHSNVSSTGNKIRDTLQNVWNVVVANARAGWTNLVNTILGFLGNLSSAAGRAKDAILAPFLGAGSWLISAGKAAIQGLIDGASSMLGALRKKVEEAANLFKKLLGFHSPPDEGPAHDSDTWMPNMMRMFATGIDDQLPTLHSSLTSASGAIANKFMTPNIAASQVANTSGQGNLAVVNFNLDGKQVAQYTVDFVNKKIVQSGASRMAR